jgi:excisionase family DNA binding protein
VKIGRQTYTVTEMAGLLGVSISTIYRRIEDNTIPVLSRQPGQGYRCSIEKFHEIYPELRPLFQLSLPFPALRSPQAPAEAVR